MVSKEQKKKTTKKSGSQLRIFFNIIGQYHALWLQSTETISEISWRCHLQVEESLSLGVTAKPRNSCLFMDYRKEKANTDK